MPNAYNGDSGHSLLLVQDVVVQMIAEGGYYIASADCKYFTYVYDRTYGASLSLEAGDVISLVGQMYVYYGLDELTSVSWVRRQSPSSLPWPLASRSNESLSGAHAPTLALALTLCDPPSHSPQVQKTGKSNRCPVVTQTDLSPFTYEAGHHGCSREAEMLENRLMTLVDVQVVKLGIDEMGLGSRAQQANDCIVNGQSLRVCQFLVRDGHGNLMLVDGADPNAIGCMFDGTCAGYGPLPLLLPLIPNP